MNLSSGFETLSADRSIPRLASPEVDECEEVDERTTRNKNTLGFELEDQVLRRSPSLISPTSCRAAGAPFLLTPSPSLSPSSSSLKIFSSHFRQSRTAKISSYCACQGCTRRASGRRACKETVHYRRFAMLPLSQSFSGRFESLSVPGVEGQPASSGSGRSTNGLSQSPWQRFPAMLHNNLGRYISRKSFNGGDKTFINERGRSDNGEYRENRERNNNGKEEQNFVRSISCDASLNSGLANILLLKVTRNCFRAVWKFIYLFQFDRKLGFFIFI